MQYLSNLNVATSGTLACDVTGASVLATGGASTMIDATRMVYIGDVVAALLTNTTEATTLAFTSAADIFTATNTR
jgi:hypothetical protein